MQATSNFNQSFVSGIGYLLIACVLIVCWTGCGDAGRVEVEGQVSFQGVNLKGGSVTFLSSDHDGLVAAGLIDSEGRYRLRETQGVSGVLPGVYQVAIRSFEGGALDGAPPDADSGARVVRIPESYADVETSGLTVTVDKTTTTVNFDLTDPAP